ncbi:MAG: TetR/AcrR family transcriptional regulator [Bacteroidota bacterium]
MNDLSTKQRILNSSIHLFNEYGLANVRLQQIANETGISVGNLAYHYRNKEAILSAVTEQLFAELENVLSNYRIFPNLLDFDNQLTQYFSFLQQYPFLFLDSIELQRTYPPLHKERIRCIKKMLQQIRMRFDFNIQRGILIPEPMNGIYDRISESVWCAMCFWLPMRSIQEEKHDCQGRFKQLIWSQFFPYLTEKGVEEFNQLILPMLSHHRS